MSSQATRIYLSTIPSQQRHAHFPLFSHPTDALHEAVSLLSTTEPFNSGFYCSLKGLRTLLDSSTPYAALLESLQNLTLVDEELPIPETDQLIDYLEWLQWEAAGLPDEPLPEEQN